MTRRRAAVVAATLVSCGLAPGVSHAQQPEATATIDTKKECVAASERAQTQRDDGRYRAARESLMRCSRDVCPKVVAQACARWLQELDPLVPTVVLGATDEKGNDLTDATVSLDGQPFATRLDGKPLEADTGEHVFRFGRAGSVPAELKVVLKAGEKARVVTVTLHAAPEEPPPAAAGEGSEQAAPATEQTPRGEAPSGGGSAARLATAAAMLGGAVAAAGVGVAFSVMFAQQKSDAVNLRANLASDACTNVSSATCSALNGAVTSQYRDVNVATGLYTGAGVLAVAAIATWFLWPQEAAAPAASAAMVPLAGGALLRVEGAF